MKRDTSPPAEFSFLSIRHELSQFLPSALRDGVRGQAAFLDNRKTPVHVTMAASQLGPFERKGLMTLQCGLF